jgi:hypothetical protein
VTTSTGRTRPLGCARQRPHLAADSYWGRLDGCPIPGRSARREERRSPTGSVYSSTVTLSLVPRGAMSASRGSGGVPEVGRLDMANLLPVVQQNAHAPAVVADNYPACVQTSGQPCRRANVGPALPVLVAPPLGHWPRVGCPSNESGSKNARISRDQRCSAELSALVGGAPPCWRLPRRA